MMKTSISYLIILLFCFSCKQSEKSEQKSQKSDLELSYDSMAIYVKNHMDSYLERLGQSEGEGMDSLKLILTRMSELNLHEFKDEFGLRDFDVSMLIQSINLTREIEGAFVTLDNKIERQNQSIEKMNQVMMQKLMSDTAEDGFTFELIKEPVDTTTGVIQIHIHGEADSNYRALLKRQYPNKEIIILEGK